MSANQLNEKTRALVLTQIWRARLWSRECQRCQRRYQEELAKPFTRQEPHRMTYFSDESYRYKTLRREVMKVAREIAETFGLPCARRTIS